MRLIDADALIEKCKDIVFKYPSGHEYRHRCVDPDVIREMPTIEERKTGKWVGVKEYCDHLNEEAEREGKGSRYRPSGMNIRVYCNQCWEPNNIRTPYCPLCGCEMEEQP